MEKMKLYAMTALSLLAGGVRAVNQEQLEKIAEPLLKSGYGNYLINLIKH